MSDDTRIDRRSVLGATAALAAAAAIGPGSALAAATSGRRFRKIGTEEAFSLPFIAAALKDVARNSRSNSLDLPLVRDIYDAPPGGSAVGILENLLDIEDRRLKDMDANGVDMHLLSLTAPGVQMFNADLACELATRANDALAEVIRRHPTRFAGIGSFAPQAPRRAAKEIERARRELKLNGFVVNSHTDNEYLDDEKFWDILEAAEATDSAIYIHPRSPSDPLAGPFRQYGMDTAYWGYGMEVSTHAVRMISNGVFERFPKLRIVLGHMGEGIPFWLWRLDYMSNASVARGLMKKWPLKPSEYFKRNFAITTSGVEDPRALQYSLDVLGADNVMWAIDYPYQPTAPAVKFIDEAPIPDAVKKKVCFDNAARIFHLSV